MLSFILQSIAPHYCYGCNKIGTLLCSNCKYDIISEPFSRCINCLCLASDGLCVSCRSALPYSGAWVVGERTEILRRLSDDLKFERRKDAAKICAELLDGVAPLLPKTTIVTYVPTSSRHIRQRGYDHAALIARYFAQRRRLVCRQTIERVDNNVQHGASRTQRIKQAAGAYRAKQIESGKTYFVIDDIFTTGATMNAVSSSILKNHATRVFIGLIARQPLD